MNILKNEIPTQQADALVKIMRSKDSLASLCGLSGNETELDFSNQSLGAGDAVLIANDIRDNGALTLLNVSNNSLGRYWDKSKREWISDMTGVKALAAAIPKCK